MRSARYLGADSKHKHRCPLDQINIDLTKVRPPQMLAWIRGVGLSSQEIDRRVQALVNAKVVGRA